MRIRTLFFIAFALIIAQTSFGGTVSGSNGTVSSCSNLSGAPFDINGTYYAYFDCSLRNDVSSYSFDLTPLMTEAPALLADNLVGAGYFVVINGNPLTLPPDNTGLYNKGLWQTVLFFPNDQATLSDSLTVYWPAAFGSIGDNVKTYDENLYPAFNDSDFFIQSTFPKTVFQPNGVGTDEYDVYVPEPGTIVLLGSSLALLGCAVLRRRRAAGRVA